MFRRVTLYRVTVVSGKLRRKAVFSRRRTPVRSGHAVPHRIDRGGGKRKYEGTHIDGQRKRLIRACVRMLLEVSRAHMHITGLR
jgi:hypothetical protein